MRGFFLMKRQTNQEQSSRLHKKSLARLEPRSLTHLLLSPATIHGLRRPLHTAVDAELFEQ